MALPSGLAQPVRFACLPQAGIFSNRHRIMNELNWYLPAKSSSKRNRVIVAGILLVFGVLLGVVWQDWIFGVLLFVAGSLIFLPSKAADSSRVTMNQTGILINQTKFSYADIKSFWIDFTPEVKELSLELKKWYMPLIYLPLGDQNPLPVREILARFLPEKHHQRSLIDAVMAKLEL